MFREETLSEASVNALCVSRVFAFLFTIMMANGQSRYGTFSLTSEEWIAGIPMSLWIAAAFMAQLLLMCTLGSLCKLSCILDVFIPNLTLEMKWLSMMTPKYLYCLTISMFCLPIWKVLFCFWLVLKAIILVLDAVMSRAVCSFLASLGTCEIMAMSSA